MVTASQSFAATTWLAVDVGNSRVKSGVFSSSDQGGGLPAGSLFLTSGPGGGINWAALQEPLGSGNVRSVIVGSNQQGVDAVLAAWPDQFPAPPPIVFRDSVRFPIEVDVESPRRVGLDRLLTAIAANRLRSADRAAIVVDCGTATTVDLISMNGVFLGGAILPGFELCAKALHRYTEVLPLVTMDELLQTDERGQHPVLGRNTHAAISSGIFWGQVGAVRELIARQSTLVAPAAPQVFVTGGGGELLFAHLENAGNYPYLALQGLVIAAESHGA
ncbi:type III pantothenate kinase [bacterium]|nr:type III pantothenate kinase [bacterium]